VNGLGCVNQTEEFGQLLFNVSVTGVKVNNVKKGNEGKLATADVKADVFELFGSGIQADKPGGLFSDRGTDEPILVLVKGVENEL